MATKKMRPTWTPWPLTALLLAACSLAACGPPPEPAPLPPTPTPHPTVSAAPLGAPAPPLTPPALRLPKVARPDRYDLDLTLVPNKETFSGVIGIDLKLVETTSVLWLNGTDLKIKDARVKVATLELAAHPVAGGDDFIGFTLDHPIGPGPARITIAYEGLLDKERSRGLYRQSEGAGEDDWYIYSFFEPIDGRRAFPCFDEPNYKVPWKLTLHVKKGHVALTNAKVAKETDEPSGMKAVAFEETKPLPSYLVALIVGPFDLVNASPAGHYNTPLRFAVPRGRGGETRYAAEVTPKIIGLHEAYFGMPYPYGKLDVAVVPRFWGTMEHPGLVALGQPLTLIKSGEETPARRQSYANIAIHELAHYWFGDYVTMAWWDDTWLNEALASWMDSKITHQLEPGWKYDLGAILGRSWAMSTDSLAGAKKIRQPTESKDDIANAFDNSITYAKGAAILGMFESFVGPDKWKKGIQRYMKAHAWGNATADDLLGALSAEGGQDIGPAMKTFLDQPGVPLISAEPVCAKGAKPLLKIAQRRLVRVGSTVQAGATWQVPVCVKYGAKQAVGRACTLLTAPSAELAIEADKGCPEWVMMNENAAGYYRSSYSPEALSRLLEKEAKSLTDAERMAVVADTAALVETGTLLLGDALKLVPAMLKGAGRHTISSSLEIVGDVHRELLSDELRAKYAKYIRKLYGDRAKALGWTPKPGESDDVRLLRRQVLGIVTVGGEDAALQKEARGLVLKWLDDRSAISPDMVQTALFAAVKAKDAKDKELWARLLAKAKELKDRRERSEILRVLGAFKDPALTKQALDLLLGTEFDLRDSSGLLYGALFDLEMTGLAYDFLKKNFDALTSRMRSDESMQLLTVPQVYCDEAHRADAEAFFPERAKKIDGGPRVLSNALEELGLCIAKQKLNQKSIEEFLKKL